MVNLISRTSHVLHMQAFVISGWCMSTRNTKQDSWATAKMTARCALWVPWKFG